MLDVAGNRSAASTGQKKCPSEKGNTDEESFDNDYTATPPGV
jgi:hypothetical protein